MPDSILPASLRWLDCETSLGDLAAGLVDSSEVLHWQSQARRLTPILEGCRITVHHWVPAAANGLPPLVLLHGGSGSWTHWVRSIGPLLDAGHDVWAVDLPGFGDSLAPAGVQDADGLIPILSALLQTLFPQQAIRLLGFSFGGMTAGMLAAAQPQLVAQLVLVGAPGIGLSSRHPLRLKGWRHLTDAREQLLHHIHNLRVLMLRDVNCISRDTVALHVRNVQRDRLPRRRISSTDILVRSLPGVQCPVAALYGACDALYPGALDEVEARLSTSARHWRGMQRIADAGHWVQYEQPAGFHAALLPLLEH